MKQLCFFFYNMPGILKEPNKCTQNLARMSSHTYFLSPQIGQALTRVDEAVGRLMEGLYKRNMHNCANIIIIADHGIRIQIAFLIKKKNLRSNFLFQFLVNVMMVFTLGREIKHFGPSVDLKMISLRSYLQLINIWHMYKFLFK